MDKYDSCKECFHNPEGDKYIPTLKNFCYSCNGDIWGGLKTLSNNSVNHPSHYNQGSIETIDYIEETTKNIKDGFEGFLVANIIKYVSRYPYKNGIEDLNKAQWYLNELVKYKSRKIGNKPNKYSIIPSNEFAEKIISGDIDINLVDGVFTEDGKTITIDMNHMPCKEKETLLKQCEKYNGFVLFED